MKQIRFFTAMAFILSVLGLGLGLTARPVAAQGGTTITSAVFSVYATDNSGQTVNVHRITTPWSETGVTWNNFNNGFDPAVIASFTVNATGWYSADVTSLVQQWLDGAVPNYGLLLEQGFTDYTTYNSSEYATTAERPKLDICYTTAGNPTETCFTIQRPNGTVADAYVWVLQPDTNFNYEALFTGNFSGGEKYSLFRFELHTPTAVTIQSLTAHSAASPGIIALVTVSLLGVGALIIVRTRRAADAPTPR
jgi:hypothetical protein